MSDGQFFHESILLEQSNFLKAIVEGKSGVQFFHRTFAYVVVFLMVLLYFKSKKFALNPQQQKGIILLQIVVLLQFTLGVLTLLFHVPLWLGLAHQLVAFGLLTTMVYTLHRLSK